MFTPQKKCLLISCSLLLAFSCAISIVNPAQGSAFSECDKNGWCVPNNSAILPPVDKIFASGKTVSEINIANCDTLSCIMAVLTRSICLLDTREGVRDYSCEANALVKNSFGVNTSTLNDFKQANMTFLYSHELNHYFRDRLDANHFNMPVFSLKIKGETLLKLNLKGKYELNPHDRSEYFILVDAVDSHTLTSQRYILGGKEDMFYVIRL